MQHETHQMHTNSLLSFSEIRGSLDERKKIIFNTVATLGPMTDREICQMLEYREMNMVRPRITELVQSGRLVELAKVKDSDTGKSVRVVSLPNSFTPGVQIA